jgi:Metallopeptidase toxin 4
MMELPANPTALQVKHELGHYLDFKTLGFENYSALGRVGRESSVLDRLQSNRIWGQLNSQEKTFSIDYVERLKNGQ